MSGGEGTGRRQRALAIFDAVVDLAAVERTARLDALCAGDAAE